MDVYEAVTSRRAVRGFTDQPVPREVLERVLSAARRSPSGSNIQPWNIYVLTGAPLAELKKRAVERVATGAPWDEREYEMYDLERDGLAVRKSVPGDRRVRAVEITPKGLELFDAAHVAAEPLAERLVSVMEPGEAEQFKDLLTRFTSSAEE